MKHTRGSSRGFHGEGLESEVVGGVFADLRGQEWVL